MKVSVGNVRPSRPCFSVSLVAELRLLVGAAVNHFSTISPVVNLSSLSLRDCVQPRSGCVCWEAAESSSIAQSVNTNTLTTSDAQNIYSSQTDQVKGPLAAS